MNETDYQAIIALSVMVWRIIAAIREPILNRVRDRLNTAFINDGKQLYSVFVWTLAFVIAYGFAMGAGDNGNILLKLEWLEGNQEIGWAATAGIIASGSAGLRLLEKWAGLKLEAKA